MPNYTTVRGRRTTFRRRRAVKPTATVKGYQINALAKRMKRMMPKLEWKRFDSTFAAAVVTSAGVVTQLSNVAPGDEDDQRDGDKFFIRSLLLRLSLVPSSVAGTNFLRILIVQDRQCNGVTPTVAQILQSASHLAPMNETWFKRFKPIHDRTYAVDSDANGPQVDKFYRKMRIMVETAGGASIPNTNGLFLLAISDAAVNGPTLEWQSRIRFTDG